jgi:hypothetical protein
MHEGGVEFKEVEKNPERHTLLEHPVAESVKIQIQLRLYLFKT